MEKGKTLHEGALFADLEKSDITILMGSRAFFESWDSNRPNVINFINIGTSAEAKKFITQSIGRGVRIEPLPATENACRICCPPCRQKKEPLWMPCTNL